MTATAASPADPSDGRADPSDGRPDPSDGRASPSDGRASRSEVAAAAIRTRIRRDRLAPGTPLGSQASLIAEMGLSRGAGLEALEILASQGIVEMRRGRLGGCFVARPAVSTVARSAAAILAFDDVSMKELTDARLLVEPPLAAAAARSRGHRRVAAALEELNQATARAAEDRPEHERLCAEFHAVLARAGGNRALGLFAAVLQDMTRADRVARCFDGTHDSRTLQVHARIAAAVRDGDPGVAEALMARHLRASAAVIAAVSPWAEAWTEASA